MTITNSIIYAGFEDKTIDLFESQYVVPEGVTYNSYIIMDEKIAVMDTVDKVATEQWLERINSTLNGREPDYLVISHLEPDHSASIKVLADKFPNMKLVATGKAFAMLPRFFDFEFDIESRKHQVKEGDSLSLGEHTLNFIEAPMVHWPEVMMTYESSDKVLFSADAFGKFGMCDTQEDWDCEARRYYFNIVGKYGVQVQSVLKKAEALDIKVICPLHGPVLKENLEHYINKYKVWSSYEPEDEGVVIAYASIHGNTKEAAIKLGEILTKKGAPKVTLFDLSRDDQAEAVEDAFRYSKLVLASATYDGGLFPPMEEFLHHLKAKTYRKRKVAFIENGSWAISAGKHMKAVMETLKDIDMVEKVVTIKSTLKEENIPQLEELADSILQ